MGNKQANGGTNSGEGQLTKKGTFLNCACAKGKEETDGVANTRGKVTKLTEEEWAAVKAGRVSSSDNIKSPNFLAEELSPNLNLENKKSVSSSNGKISNGISKDGVKSCKVDGADEVNGKAPDPTSDERLQNLRFKVGDRVRCVCSRYGNKHEAGSVIKIGFREKDWPLSKPSAPYQGV